MFGHDNEWIQSTTLRQFEGGGSTRPTRQIDADEAEAILRRQRGDAGAAELWAPTPGGLVGLVKRRKT